MLCQQFNNLDEMDKFLENATKNWYKKKQKICTAYFYQRNWIYPKIFPKENPEDFYGKCYSVYNEEIKQILSNFFSKKQEERPWPNSFYKASIAQIPKPDRDITKK